MITHNDVKHIATLSKLWVKDEELDSLTEEMQKIISFAETINSAPDVSDSEIDLTDGEADFLREDEILQSYACDDILKNAKKTSNGYFLVENKG